MDLVGVREEYGAVAPYRSRSMQGESHGHPTGRPARVVRRATTVAELTAAEHLYDGPARPERAERFLAAPGHLMLIAYVDGEPAGMVSGIEMTHPDKGTEMCLYELSVDEPHRRRGIGRVLTQAPAEAAEERGCYGMWVGVERDNDAAPTTYRSARAEDDDDFAMLARTFGRTSA